MKAFYNADQSQHHPKFYMKNGKPIPARELPERGEIFLSTLARLDIEVLASKDFDLGVLSRVHSPDYLNFLRHAYADWEKLPDANKEIIPKSNPSRYAATYPDDIIGRVGWHLLDTSCPVGPGTWQGAYASSQTAQSAADYVARGESRYAYALCRPPGHHAYPDGAAGFCFINNSAVAAERLRETFDRVAIIDIDLHHGNGTQAIFWRRRDVMTVSLHADPASCYPHFWGYSHERGTDDGFGYNLNVPLPQGTRDDEYLDALDMALEQVEAFAPDAIVIAQGLDASEQDPFAVLGITTDGYARIGARLRQLDKPTVIVQEGGYISPILGDNLAAVLQNFTLDDSSVS